MDDFGGKLRQARERRGISLRQIAASTKISAAALEALERNDISKLPGGIFSRAFVRSYAVEVGLDPDDTVREFLERFNQEAPPAAAAVTTEVPEQEREFEEQHARPAMVLSVGADQPRRCWRSSSTSAGARARPRTRRRRPRRNAPPRSVPAPAGVGHRSARCRAG